MDHKILGTIKSQRFFKKQKDNIFNFIPEGEQPEWSRRLDEYWPSLGQKPDMPEQHARACKDAQKSKELQKYFSFIAGIKNSHFMAGVHRS